MINCIECFLKIYEYHASMEARFKASSNFIVQIWKTWVSTYFLNFEENIVQSKVIYILLLLTKMKLQIRLKQIRTHSWGKVVGTAFFIVIIILLLVFFCVHVLKMVMLGVSINFCTQCVKMTQITWLPQPLLYSSFSHFWQHR